MPQSSCRRCGTCCIKGGPSLHKEDLPLVDEGRIRVQDLVCIRSGEMAYDPRRGGLQSVPRELVKIRGKGASWECVCYDRASSRCRVYEARPAECRALSCADPGALYAVMEQPYATRFDIVPAESALGQCIAGHESLFPVLPALKLALEWVRNSAGPVSEELMDMVRRELHFRLAFAERVGSRDEDLWVYFGRPLWKILAPTVPALDGYGTR